MQCYNLDRLTEGGFFMAMISMFIGILTAFFVYNDAKRRGNGAITSVLWSVGSIVMPIVILPLYLLVGRKIKQQKQYDTSDVIDIEATVVEETINCSMCGRNLAEDFVVCPYCQAPNRPSNKDD